MSWLLNSFDLSKFRLKSRKNYTLRLLLIHLCCVVCEPIACKRSFLDRTRRKRELYISLAELLLKIVSVNLFNTKYMLRYLEILTFWGLYYIIFSDYTAKLSVTSGSPETMFFQESCFFINNTLVGKSYIYISLSLSIYLFIYLSIYLSIYL